MNKIFTKTSLMVILALTSLSEVQSQNISSVAGNGTAGFSGDGGPAINAQLMYPGGVCTDASGNIYIADASNQRIRKVDAATGIITTYAGNGIQGFAGDGGAATSAQLSAPNGLFMDAFDNLFIADMDNNRIRKVAAGTGIITTVAGNGSQSYSGDGGAATSAALSYPSAVAVDAAGNVYIADRFNNRVRKVSIATGIITTIGGTGSAGYSGDGAAATSAMLNNPTGISIDANDNLYITDRDNHRIRKITASTGFMSTVAGNGIQGYAGDGSLAINAQLYVPDEAVVDATGDIYIADNANHAVRKVTASTGMITTIAGTGVMGFSGDGGPATLATLSSPVGISVDMMGNVYIVDNGNGRIRKINGTTAGIAEPGISKSGSLYPNPNNGKFNVWIDDFKSDHYNIEIYNALGELILAQKDTTGIDISDKAKGIYTVRIYNGGKRLVEKIIVQ